MLMPSDSNGNVHSPIADLPLSDPQCINESCTAFAAAANLSQELVPWAGQFEYGHWTTWYYVVIIFILMVAHGFNVFQDRRSREGTAESAASFHQKVLAFGRYISYRRITSQPFDKLGLPSCGMLIFLLTTLLFLSILVFAVRPYYRYTLDFGSPPIAIRTGLMAFACMPILVALSGKANLVTLLTGISHEKLNVVHRWVAWMSFGLSIAHTIPFFVASDQAGGSAKVRKEFYANAMRGSNEYSGAPPFAILLGLCIFSLPPVRRRFYESFYLVHILLATTYVGLLFWHANNQLDSWVYLWATIALWLASYFARMFWYTQPLNVGNQWLVSTPASFLQLRGDMTRIEITAPKGFTHTPAQHCFLRFPAISLLDNHPFTIASVQRSIDSAKNKTSAEVDSPQALTFLVRTHAGFTHKLAAYCASRPDSDALAWIDGPYGGIGRPVDRLYDTLVLIAGGGGISACLPWLLYVTDKARGGAGNAVKVKRIVLVWAMKEAEHFLWAENELDEVAADGQSKVAIQMRFYITGSAEPAALTKPTEAGATEKDGDVVEPVMSERRSLSPSDRITKLGEYTSGKPVMREVVRDLVGQGKTLIIGCGPESLRADLANACAEEQVRVMKGETQELAMHLEVFGW